MSPFTSSHKVQVLLKAQTDDHAYESLLFGAGHSGINTRVAVRIPRAPASDPSGLIGDGTFVGEHPSVANDNGIFDGMLEVASAAPDWERMSTIVRQHLIAFGSHCDLDSSAVSAGTEWTLVPGGADQDATMLLYPMRRLPGLSLQQFHDYWLNVHGRFGIGNENVAGYRQFHVDHDVSSQINTELGLGIDDFDGIAESFLPTLEAFQNIKTDEGLTQEVLEDETRFIDYNTSATMELYRYRVLGPAGI